MSSESGAVAESSAEISRLFREEGRGLVRLATLLVGDVALAEDLVQDAFVALHERWQLLSDPQRAAGYLRVSVINRCRSLRRRWTVAGRYLHLAQPMPLPDADATTLLAEESRAVVGAVRRLPKRQQQVIVLRYWCDMTEAEIAQAMTISAGTVKSSASRALAKLTQDLEHYHAE
jgi:RNA polymerase sigma-70 factor (sigma-E family)